MRALQSNHLMLMLFPEDTVARRIAALAGMLRRDYRLKGKPFPADRLHITLCDLEHHVDLPPELVATAQAAAATVSRPSFEVAFDRVETWGASQSLVLVGDEGLSELTSFRRALIGALKGAGLGAWLKASFTPHVTLLRDDGIVEEQTVETFRWTVREFVLVNSLVGQSKYVHLARWALQ
jgi:2'-5' RNA ligase